MKNHCPLCWFYAFVSIIVLGTSCSSPADKPKNVIDFETEINEKNYTVQKLSDYAESLRYIPLQTNDSSLIDGDVNYYIKDLFYGNNHFIIHDDKRVLRFDGQGAYMGEIGKKGQGPEEYFALFSIDMDYGNNRMYLKNHQVSVLEYTLDGQFLRRMTVEKDSLEEHYRPFNLCVLTPGVYVIDLKSYENEQYLFAFYNEKDNTLQLAGRPVPDPEPVIKGTHKTYSPENPFHRLKDELYYI